MWALCLQPHTQTLFAFMSSLHICLPVGRVINNYDRYHTQLTQKRLITWILDENYMKSLLKCHIVIDEWDPSSSGHARLALDSRVVLCVIKYVNLCHQTHLLFTLALLLRTTMCKYAVLTENLWTVHTPVGAWDWAFAPMRLISAVTKLENYRHHSLVEYINQEYFKIIFRYYNFKII